MRYTVAIILLIVSARLYAQTPSTAISFEERVHDFGTIAEKDGKVSHTFVFQNKGTTPVVINDIYSACGCIGKVMSAEAIKPGAKGKVLITFNPAYKAGQFSKEIIVYSNNGQQYNRIWVEGKITAMEHPVEEDYPYSFGSGLYLRLKVMAFGYLKPGETRQMELHYANDSDKEMVLNFGVEGNKTGLKFTNPGRIGAKQKGVISFTYTMPASGHDDVLYRLYPYVNNKKLAEDLQVKILYDSKPRAK